MRVPAFGGMYGGKRNLDYLLAFFKCHEKSMV
jgi:hypothetical protein